MKKEKNTKTSKDKKGNQWEKPVCRARIALFAC